MSGIYLARTGPGEDKAVVAYRIVSIRGGGGVYEYEYLPLIISRSIGLNDRLLGIIERMTEVTYQ